MNRLCFVPGAVLLLLLAPAVAQADVTITWKGRAPSGPGAAVPHVRVEAIKGDFVREDQGPQGKPPVFSAIRDLKALREYLLWHNFKLRASNVLRREDRHDDKENERLRGEAAEKRAHEAALERRLEKASGVPTGKSATLLGVLCREYRYTATSEDGAFTVNGTYWMPDNGPGGREYARMYERLRGLKVGMEEEGAERESRGVRRGGAELQNEFRVVARRRGIPYKMEFEVVGQGQKVTVREEALKISISRLPASMFVVPKHYKTRG